MNLKQTVIVLAAIGTFAFVHVMPAGAVTGGSSITGGKTGSATSGEEGLKCTVLPDSICGKASEGDLENSGTWALLLAVIRIMTAGVGIVAVGMIAYAAFLYTTAMSNENQTKQAKEMIRNVAIGLAVFILMWAGIEWLIPGGIFD